MFQQLLVLLFLFSSASIVAQATSDTEVERILKIVPREVVKYDTKPRFNTLFLNTAFNNALFADSKVVQTLKDKAILKVELVYTTYRKSETFDQHSLNRKRLKALFTAAPNVISQPGIEWVLMAQTGCTSAEAGKDFFHGVVVTYRDRPTEIVTEIEKQFLVDALSGKVPLHAYDAYLKNELKKVTADSTGKQVLQKEPVFRMPQFPGGERNRIEYFTRNLKYPANANQATAQVNIQFMVDKDGRITNISFPDAINPSPFHEEVLKFVRSMPEWTPGTINGKRTDCMVQFSVDFMNRGSIIPSPLQIYAIEAPPKETKLPPSMDYSKVKPMPNSKAVTAALTKNHFSNAALVCDVTGSMVPYNVQVLDYLKTLYQTKDTSIRLIIFFNDGDKKSDQSKKVGQVEGIYSTEPTTFEATLNYLIAVMDAGNGGDIEENNLEALVIAEQKCPTCTQNIMIADNVATPRDMSLLSKLTKPVQIIVCGSTPILNENYLTIAYKTGGSILFNGKEIKDLQRFEEGATVQVGKESYILKSGKFVHRRS